VSEDRLLSVRQTYFEALSAYTREVGKTLQLLTVTHDGEFDIEAFAAQLRQEKEAFERLRELRLLYAKQFSEWEETLAQKASAG
jgi:hypothetical protein